MIGNREERSEGRDDGKQEKEGEKEGEGKEKGKGHIQRGYELYLSPSYLG